MASIQAKLIILSGKENEGALRVLTTLMPFILIIHTTQTASGSRLFTQQYLHIK